MPLNAAEPPDRVAHRAAAHLRRMWLTPFLSAAWLIAELAALPFSFVKALAIALIFAGLYVVLSWRLRVMTHVFDQRLRGVTKEHERIIQAAIREKNGILARAAGLEEQIRATILQEQTQQTEHADRQQQIELQRAAVHEAASLWPSLLSVLTRIEQQLSAADLDDLRQIGARGAFDLARAAGLDGRAALYLFDRDGQQLLRMARWPEPPRRRLPGGQRSGPRRVIGLPLRFEPDLIPLPADSAAFWTLYVKRQAFLTEDGALFDTLDDEPVARLALRMPLVSGREPVGHLSLLLTTLPPEPVQDALALVLGSLAGVAALALANASALEDARQVRAEQAFLAELSAHLVSHGGGGALAALLQERLCPLLLADVCAMSLDGKTLDGLAHPALQERRDLIHAAGLTTCACSAILQESGTSAQVTQRCAVRNPKAGACLWSRYGGVSGTHCAVAVPIPAPGPVKPALMIYRTGTEGLTPEETSFVESVAALLSNLGLEK